MKYSALMLTALALILLAAALAPVFRSDPGMVLIHFRDWTVETSVLVLLGGVLLVWLLAQFALWLYRLPAETARRMQERRALAQLEKGLLALTEGDWSTAEKALEKSAGSSEKSTARYLAAAQAADGLDAEERREYYLEQADSGGRRKKFLVELTRARMLLANHRRAEALPVLEELQRRRRNNPQVLELLARCYRELGHWDDLPRLLPVLHRKDVLNDAELDSLKIDIARHKLADAVDAESLQAAWKSLPRDMRRNARVVEVYAERAGELGHAELAESELRAHLRQHWDPKLVLRYGDPGAGDAGQRLKHCEKWLKDHPQDAALHMALGRLCAGQELWGKARHHLVKSLEAEPTMQGYDALAQLLERQGETEVAMACFRNALRMAQGRAPEPLPADPARLSAPAEK